jgi:hypothetical protein
MKIDVKNVSVNDFINMGSISHHGCL